FCGVEVFARVQCQYRIAEHYEALLRIQQCVNDASTSDPEPDYFGGEVLLAPPRCEWEDVPVTLPFADANFRSLGLAEMAHAILEGRPHRASGALALHVLEVMEALATAGREERIVDIESRVARPAPLAESPVEQSRA